MAKVKVQWMNVYGHILDDKVVDESRLSGIQKELPKRIGDDRAVGIAWFKGKWEYYWYRKDGH